MKQETFALVMWSSANSRTCVAMPTWNTIPFLYKAACNVVYVNADDDKHFLLLFLGKTYVI